MKITVFWDVVPCSFIDVSEVLSASIIIALMMEAVSTPEMSVNFYTMNQTVLFAYITNLRVEGKQMHILCKPQTLPTEELRQ
jgi:hypothetical protein